MLVVASSERGVVAVVMVVVVVVGVVVGGGRRRGRVAERRRDSGGLDGDDPGVHDLTVDLHHHLVALRGVVQTLVDRHGRHHQRHFGSAGLIVADGR